EAGSDPLPERPRVRRPLARRARRWRAGTLTFTDLALPDHNGRPRTLTELAGGDPLVLVFSRRWGGPEEQTFLRGLVTLSKAPEGLRRARGALWRGVRADWGLA